MKVQAQTAPARITQEAVILQRGEKNRKEDLDLGELLTTTTKRIMKGTQMPKKQLQIQLKWVRTMY